MVLERAALASKDSMEIAINAVNLATSWMNANEDSRHGSRQEPVM